MTDQPPKKDITIYLTGFGPFRRHTQNSSWAITSSFLPHTTIHTETHAITLQPHPHWLKVAYATVTSEIPPLHTATDNEFDYILHVGLGKAGGYHLERRAFEDGYVFGDVDGKVPGGADAAPERGIMHSEGEERREPGGREFGCALDLQWVVEGVEKFEPEETPGKELPIKVSDDAGRFLCEFIYYTSLKAACEKEGNGKLKSEKVLFMHVPPLAEPFGVETGRKVLIEVAKGMVKAGEERKVVS
ncbi:unnamed protein product [Tuber aestivum]|uniref:Peptidase C15, pyroglutamyl peptidase I-like protein n=1 Tax=Tuber aestivum TaxID=59557 RepID=A0A292Q1X4_9PEZI|nr:unnamed protein product [Tuber aestivum]